MSEAKHSHFQCTKCQTERVIETRGEVVVGPWCPKCSVRMKRIQFTQMNLDLVMDQMTATVTSSKKS